MTRAGFELSPSLRESYAFTNFVESADDYGTIEDVAMFCMQEMPVDQMHSMIEDETLISTPVNSKIQSINIVNEHQRLFKNEVQTYDVMLTRGVLFETEDGFEISLKKNVWFSEMITVRKGYHLIDTFSSPSDFAGEWEGEFLQKQFSLIRPYPVSRIVLIKIVLF